MIFGACYYAEHWPEERWAEDARMMREAGFTAVRMAEFAWTRLEPQEGVYQFDWLDRCIDLLGSNGIRVILGTPTASPPKRIMDRHPELYKRDASGHVRGFGTRMHYCFNHEGYHGIVKNLVNAMAERYKDNPNVIGWQIDNEFGCCDTTWCYCDTCRTAFRSWLKRKYGTIAALNKSWGTVVWNNEYNAFDEIELPKLTTYPLHNPGLLLDFRRFSSEAVRRFQRIQVDILRRITPQLPITHNMMGIFGEIDYYKLAEDLDVSGLDIYPNFPNREPVNPFTPALIHDVTRGFRQANYWVLEHQSGTPGGDVLLKAPKPGELRRWTYQSVAHGADAIVYFRWRTALFGGEQFWHGILGHSGTPGTIYKEVAAVGAELERLSPLLNGSVVHNEAAIVRCFENEWVFDIQPQSPGFRYMEHLKIYHRYFFGRQSGVDVISPDADFSGYRLLILPGLTMADDALAAKISRFTENGGTVVLDFRAGAKSTDNCMRAEILPGPFRELLGVEVADYGILKAEDGQRIRFAASDSAKEHSSAVLESESQYGASVWYDVVKPVTAETVARFEGGYFSGSPAVTRQSWGKGAAYYIATEPDSCALNLLLDRICREAGIARKWTSSCAEVEVAVRHKGDIAYTFVINHADTPADCILPGRYKDLLSGRTLEGTVPLTVNEVLLLVKEGTHNSF